MPDDRPQTDQERIRSAHPYPDPPAWIACAAQLPPRGVVVETKIHDDHGERNVQPLKLHDSPGSRLWFFPDNSMYCYYEPTHWRFVER